MRYSFTFKSTWCRALSWRIFISEIPLALFLNFGNNSVCPVAETGRPAQVLSSTDSSWQLVDLWPKPWFLCSLFQCFSFFLIFFANTLSAVSFYILINFCTYWYKNHTSIVKKTNASKYVLSYNLYQVNIEIIEF